MSPHPVSTNAPTAAAPVKPTPIGVGIDTSRYGHHATFLRPDLQPAAADLDFAESAAGYAQLRQRLDVIAQHLGLVHFHFRLDVAGAYADNLLAFLHRLTRGADATPLAVTISCGEPQRNKNYRVALFGHKKSDPVESAAVARFALTEQPKPTPPVPAALRLLRQVAGRLEAQTRQCTRLVNQLHHLLARVFPELALATKDMCPRGSDLVRRYLYNCALSAAQHNPAVRPLYPRPGRQWHRPRRQGPRAQTHLVFAVWKSGKPFDPQHYPWEKPAHLTTSDIPVSQNNEPAAGHTPEAEPDRSVVTAAGPSPVAAPAEQVSDISMSQDAAPSPWVDFAHLRSQLSLARVLEHLGLSGTLRGRGAQRRGPCPVHAPDGKGRTFSVNLEQNVCQCFDAACGLKGDVIDLWAAVKQLALREAALDLVRTFALEPAPATEKRHG